MTKEQLDKMTNEEIKQFEHKLCVFDKSQSFEDYANDMRDLIYLYRRKDRERCVKLGVPIYKGYTYEGVSEKINRRRRLLMLYYGDREPVAEAETDFSYSCG